MKDKVNHELKLTDHDGEQTDYIQIQKKNNEENVPNRDCQSMLSASLLECVSKEHSPTSVMVPDPNEKSRKVSAQHSTDFIDVRRRNETENGLQIGYKRKKRVRLPNQSNIVALDCEMVGIGYKGRISSAAWIVIIDWFGTVLLDEYIAQEEPVTDYRTSVSGITEHDLKRATTTLAECRIMVLNILRGKVLVGHSLRSDLNALGITQNHPWWLVRDTARFRPFLHDYSGNGKLMPRKLRDLAKEHLQREIQVPGKPHSPYEDAMASLDLYKSVRTKWEDVMTFKLRKTRQIQQEQETRQ